jgi:Mlc titration factor MtfA (ptsG expression regulator)
VLDLPAPQRNALLGHMQVFLAEKSFIGCQGLVVNDVMRVTIAAQACLLLLGQTRGYFPRLRQILLYPGSFLVQRTRNDGSGVTHEWREALSGESWSEGQIVLSWQDAQADAAHPEAGNNVVIHECAHQLDQDGGAANGAPHMRDPVLARQWRSVMRNEFHALRWRLQRGLPGLIGAYGATEPGEFFAVLCEVFVLRARELRAEHPELADLLERYFEMQPGNWPAWPVKSPIMAD